MDSSDANIAVKPQGESNQIICKVCRVIKTRIIVEAFPSGNRKYRDESGGIFNGKVCPDCDRIRAKQRMRRHRGTL